MNSVKSNSQMAEGAELALRTTAGQSITESESVKAADVVLFVASRDEAGKQYDFIRSMITQRGTGRKLSRKQMSYVLGRVAPNGLPTMANKYAHQLAQFAAASHLQVHGNKEYIVTTTNNTNPVYGAGDNMKRDNPRGEEKVFDPNAFGEVPPADPDELEQQIEILLEQGKKKEAQQLIDQYNKQLDDAVGVDGVNPENTPKVQEAIGPINWEFTNEVINNEDLKEFKKEFDRFRRAKKVMDQAHEVGADYRKAKEMIKLAEAKIDPNANYYDLDGIEVKFVDSEEPPF